MKYAIIAVFIALSFSSHGQGEISRQYDLAQDMNVFDGDVVVEFFKNDRVVLNIRVFRDGYPMYLPQQNAYYLWEIMSKTNRTMRLYTSSGTASTNGTIQFIINPENSGINSGSYFGYITMTIGSEYQVSEHCVAQKHIVSILDGFN